MTKELFFQNPLFKAVLLVHTTLVFDLGLRFGKLQTDIDDFYSNFTNQLDTDGTVNIRYAVSKLNHHFTTTDTWSRTSKMIPLTRNWKPFRS